MKLKYHRIMLKMSGEALLGSRDSGIDSVLLQKLCEEIKVVKALGVEIAIVIGGGNIWRYRQEKGSGLDRVTLDSMGMVATVMNALAMQSMFEKIGVDSRVLSALEMPKVAEPYVHRRALYHLERGRIVLCAGGTGSPFFTTDSAAALRALELNCDVLLKATNVDGVYTEDPKKHKHAKKIPKLTYHEVLERDLTFMDQAAVSLCREGNIPILIFRLGKNGNIAKAVKGDSLGTLVHSNARAKRVAAELRRG